MRCPWVVAVPNGTVRTWRIHVRAARRALEELGPPYIKAGQILSTRPDMVSAAMIEEFRQLHD